jgi:hypothetical protein
MQIWRYTLQNDTLNSVFDSDSNKTITKKIRPKGLKSCSGKGMASLYYYDLAWLSKAINRYNVGNDKISWEISWYCFIESNCGIIVFIAYMYTEPKI